MCSTICVKHHAKNQPNKMSNDSKNNSNDNITCLCHGITYNKSCMVCSRESRIT